MKGLLKNPLSIWLWCYMLSIILMIKNRKLKIGYLSNFKNVKFGIYNTMYSYVSIKNSQLGDFVYIANGTKINNASIGSFCSIGQDVKIGLGIHPVDFISTHPCFYSARKQCQISFFEKNDFNEFGVITIGNDVWIGSNVVILDNVTIGDGAIIATGAVVVKDVKPYEIVGGIPAKLIKKRFNDDKIEQLLKVKWWNKDIHWIKENSYLFSDPNRWFKEFNQ